MRDIVATIAPDQDDLVRADVSRTVCVQGAPGTGKTVVGLHRAAFLLYAHRDRLRRGVLVVGPNRSFLEYVAGVLPALGEVDARHATVEELVARVPVRDVDSPEVATLKGDSRLAEVIRRAVWSRVAAPGEPLIVPRGSRRWRMPAHVVAEAIDELRSREDVRYGAARLLLSQRLAHLVLVQMEAAGESPDDRVQDAVARSRPVKSYVDRVWPAVDAVKTVLGLLSDPGRLAAAAAGILDPGEIESLCWATPPRGPGSARWSAADAVLVDEAADVIERTTSLGHVVLDEAQDLSPMQLRAVGRRCATGSATVLGDLAQGTTAWATASWRESLRHLGKAQAEVTELVQGYRVPSQIIDFASRLLPHIAAQLTPPTSIREDPGALRVIRAADVFAATVAAARTSLEREGSIGIITADAATVTMSKALEKAGLDHHVLGRDEHTEFDRLVLVPAALAKGLEYDCVVVAEPAEIVAAEPSEQVGLRRLYVALTRAVSGLTVVHSLPLPATLDRP
jgi:DNA helicase IV